ncbi:MAG: F0F1 ATP synthase subunit B family protein [Candidatus Nitrospinota bacterium M3_3B_026]
MLIDWFTVFAQIVNFLILVYLLKRFLYKPIVNAMAEREKRIASRLEEAAAKTARAEAEEASYKQMRGELEETREKLLEGAEREAGEKRKELLAEARDEVDKIRSIWEDELERDKETFLRQLRQRTADRMVSILRAALEEMAGASLEREVARAFLARLKSLDAKEREAIAETLGKNGGGVTVVSGFDLPPEIREKISESLRDIIGAEARFETSPEPIMGIEIEAGGRRIEWSLAGYLAGLEEELRAAISKNRSGGER